MNNVCQKYTVNFTINTDKKLVLRCFFWLGLYLFSLPGLADNAEAPVKNQPDVSVVSMQQNINNPSSKQIPAENTQQANSSQSRFTTTTQPAYAPRSIGLADFISSFTFLIVIIGLIFVLAWLFKRTGLTPNSGNQVIKIVSAVALSQKDKIALVEVGEQQVLISVSPGNIKKLMVLDNPVKLDENAETSVTSSFSNQLVKLITKEKNAN